MLERFKRIWSEQPELRFWLVLGLIVVVGAVPRFLTYDFSLPYVDHPDESFFYLAGQGLRGLNDQSFYVFYPPGIVFLQAGVQIVLEKVFRVYGAAGAIQAVRFLATLANLGTIILTALLARQIADEKAGWIAAALYALAPMIVREGVLAIPDVFLYLAFVAAFYLAALALSRDNAANLILWSLIAGLVVVAFKYNVMAGLVPAAIATLVYVRRDFKARWWLILAEVMLILGFVGLSVLRYDPAFWQRPESGVPFEDGVRNMLNPAKITHRIWFVFAWISPALVLPPLAIGGIALGYAIQKGERTIRHGIAVIGLLLIFTVPFMVGYFSDVAGRPKDIIPVISIVFALVGAGLIQIEWAMHSKFGHLASWLVVAVAVMVFGIYAYQLIPLIRDRTRSDSRVDLRAWFNVNVESEWVLVDYEHQSVFNPMWGGLTGPTWVNWWLVDEPQEIDVVQFYRERGVPYAAIAEWRYEALPAEQREQLLVLNHFGSPEQRGPVSVALRLYPPEHALDLVWEGGIHAIAYDLAIDSVPGGSVELRLYWQADQSPSLNYSLFMHLVPDATYEVLAQSDGSPGVPHRPTSTWADADEVIVGDLFS